MDELEQRLRSMRLARPSADLDRRLQEAFDAAHTVALRKRTSRFWWWLMPAAAACSMAAFSLVLLQRQDPEPAPVVHRIAAEGRLRDLLLNSVADQDPASLSFVVRIDAP